MLTMGQHASHALVCFGNFLEDWVLSTGRPTEVKASDTRRYVLANDQVASLFGMTRNEMVGLDLNAIAPLNNLKESFFERICEADYKVVQTGQKQRFKQVFFTQHRTILCEELTKYPIFNHKGKVIAILNDTQNLTPFVDPFTLFAHYKDLYCNVLRESENCAIEALLKHLQLDGFFSKTPSTQELVTLLTMRTASQTKYVARAMKVSPKTVELYKSNIRKKLHTPDFYTLLARLRTKHEYSSIK